MKFFTVVILAMLVPARSQAAWEDPSSRASIAREARYAVQRDIVFSRAGGAELAADLYRPHLRRKTPAIIYLHGGGWWEGNRTQLHRLAEDLAADGYFGMTVDYRLAPAVTFPVPQQDVAEAIRWLRARAAQYNIDPTRIILLGSSAGAHLALMHVLAPTAQAPSVVAVVAVNPVLDLTDEANESAMVTLFLGKTCESDLPLCQSASPEHLSLSGKPQRARILLLHGTKDQVVPYSQAEETFKALSTRGDKVELFTAEGAPHTFWAKEEWYRKVLTRVEAFLREYLH